MQGQALQIKASCKERFQERFMSDKKSMYFFFKTFHCATDWLGICHYFAQRLSEPPQKSFRKVCTDDDFATITTHLKLILQLCKSSMNFSNSTGNILKGRKNK